MIEKLSLADIRRWLVANLPRGKQKMPWNQRGRELPFKALARAVGIDFSDLHKMRDGDVAIGRRAHDSLSRFIRDWENGYLEFGERPAKGRGGFPARVLVHRTTPRPTRIRFTASWQEGAKLTIQPRPAANPRIPNFRDIFTGLAKPRTKL